MRTRHSTLCLALPMLLALAGPAGAQEDPPMLECGNAFYDDGTAVGFDWFDGGEAGDPDKMFAVRFDLADFSYEPGRVELAGICAGNLLSVGGLFPNDIFVYPDADGLPDDSVVLARGRILTGNGVGGASVVMFEEPITLHGDFWLVNRGDEALATTDFNMEHDEAPPEEPEEQHSFTSSAGIENLEPAAIGDYMLRAYLQPIERSYLTPGIARVGGVNQTEWRSSYAVLNTGDAVVEATATFLVGEDTTTVTGPVGPGQLVVWDDVVTDLFGIEDEVSGSIELAADGPLVVTARTYNIRPEGTVGQFFPGFEADDGLGFGQRGVVSQLAQNEAFRTNLGYINLSDDFCRVETTLYDASGLQVGEARVRQVEAGEWRQVNNIFIQQGAGEQDDGYAVVEVLNEGCTMWAYGSVIDSGTGDPTTIPVVVE